MDASKKVHQAAITHSWRQKLLFTVFCHSAVAVRETQLGQNGGKFEAMLWNFTSIKLLVVSFKRV